MGGTNESKIDAVGVDCAEARNGLSINTESKKVQNFFMGLLYLGPGIVARKSMDWIHKRNKNRPRHFECRGLSYSHN